MAGHIIANQSTPATPSAGFTAIYPDSTTKKLVSLADDGVPRMVQPLTNAATADLAISAATNTYLVGASLAIPPTLLRAGALFHWDFCVSKTGAQTGTAAPVWTVVFGVNNSISDAARLTFTGVAQTASVADTAKVTIDVIVRVAGASGIIEGFYFLTHFGAGATQVTGLANQPTDVKQATSAAFDLTVASSFIGIAVNFGANTAATMLHSAVIGYNL